MRTQRVDDIDVIRDAVEVPGLGALAINAFVLHADQPVLVDTGRPVEREAFLAALESVINPADIRWIWLTHPDRDHMGALFDVLALAPHARLVTTFIAAGYLSVEYPVPFERVQIVNPGQSLEVGRGRTLHAFRPPLFDSPMTVGLLDDGIGTCISSDCFGGLLPSVEAAYADDVADLDSGAVRAGQAAWAMADSPWVTSIDPAKFARTYTGLRHFAPRRIMSTHLPPATGQLPAFLELLETVPDTQPMDPPDQAFLDTILREAFGEPAHPPATPRDLVTAESSPAALRRSADGT